MAAVAIKAKILGEERWLAFNVAAQMHIAQLHGGSIEAAMQAFSAALFPSEAEGNVGENDRMQVIADWLAALTYGGRVYARHMGEDSEAVTADEFLAMCSPFEVGEIATAITEAVTAGQQREVENPPENAAKKN